jgi:flagellar biosynthetic protein FliS
MDEAYNADSSKGYEPLTDDEKSAMTDDEVEKWETKIKDSLLRKDDTEKAHTNIVKAEMIIEELQSTLNRKYPVAEDFDNVYKYIYSLLVDANMKKDTQVLDQALVELRGMRDTWKEVMAKAGN